MFFSAFIAATSRHRAMIAGPSHSPISTAKANIVQPDVFFFRAISSPERSETISYWALVQLRGSPYVAHSERIQSALSTFGIAPLNLTTAHDYYTTKWPECTLVYSRTFQNSRHSPLACIALA